MDELTSRLPGLPLGLVRPRGCRRRPLPFGKVMSGGRRRRRSAVGLMGHLAAATRSTRRDAVREPGRGRRGPGHAAARRRRRLCPARRQRGPAGRADRRRAVRPRACRTPWPGRGTCSRCSSQTSRSTTTPGRRPLRPGASPRSSTLCSLAGSTRRQRLRGVVRLDGPGRRLADDRGRPAVRREGRRHRPRRRTRHGDERDHGRAPRGGDRGQPDPHRRARAPPRGGAQPGPSSTAGSGFRLSQNGRDQADIVARRSPTPT